MMSKSVADGLVRAPFDGVVAEKNVAPGEWVAPGKPLFTLVDDDPLKIELSVPEVAVRDDQARPAGRRSPRSRSPTRRYRRDGHAHRRGDRPQPLADRRGDGRQAARARAERGEPGLGGAARRGRRRARAGHVRRGARRDRPEPRAGAAGRGGRQARQAPGTRSSRSTASSRTASSSSGSSPSPARSRSSRASPRARRWWPRSPSRSSTALHGQE